MRRLNPLLIVSMLTSVGVGCASHGVQSQATDSPKVVTATFTTMGNMIVAPGRTTTCPAWFWEQWTVSIHADGRSHVEVTDGKRAVFSRDHLLSQRNLARLLAFLEAEMIKGPATLGAAATDSDYGEITLLTDRGEFKLTAEGAGEVRPGFAHFYHVIRYLERHLHIPNPYCQ